MGRLIQQRLGGELVYCCVVCGTDLCKHSEIVSKSFHGRNGRAYLFERACVVRVPGMDRLAREVNVDRGPPEDRILMTGLHTVCDVYCKGCQSPVGWTYLHAHDPRERYKVNRFVVEKAWLARSPQWVAPGATADAAPEQERSPPPAGGPRARPAPSFHTALSAIPVESVGPAGSGTREGVQSSAGAVGRRSSPRGRTGWLRPAAAAPVAADDDAEPPPEESPTSRAALIDQLLAQFLAPVPGPQPR